MSFKTVPPEFPDLQFSVAPIDPAELQAIRDWLNKPVVPVVKAMVPLIDQITPQGMARLDGAGMLERALQRYDEPGLNFLSEEFRDHWIGQTVCIHGSGPSIEDTFPELLELVAGGAKVCAINAAHDWLLERGIAPDFGVMADPKPWVAGYQTPQPDTTYLIASSCHDDVFARFKGHSRMLVWHALGAETEDLTVEQARRIAEKARTTGRGAYMNTGGSTTTMRSCDAMSFLGFRREHLFGVDSSGRRANDATVMHGHAKPHAVAGEMRPVYVNDPSNHRDLAHPFWSNPPMEHQALHWEMILRSRFNMMRDGTYPITQYVVHGDGLWPALAAMHGMHYDAGYAERLRAEGYLDPEQLKQTEITP